MRKSFRLLLLGACLLLSGHLFTACDDETAGIGTDVMPGFDIVSVDTATYRVTSRSVAVDSVLANTTECHLGCIIDPETRAKTSCSFLAQFHLMENYKLPDLDRMVLDNTGRPFADSCDIRIFFDKYYGDSLTTMKLLVQELDTNKVMEENVRYYTSLKPEDYVNRETVYKKSLTYTVNDMSRDRTDTDQSQNYRSIVVRMPAEYGTFILRKYYENPDFFRNSYEFIHHVCPGFYFKNDGGVGSMVNVRISTLNVYFRYHDKTAAGNDTIVEGMQRLGATEEVIQNTRVENRIPESMLWEENPFSYVKSPSGIFTEATLPVNEITAGEHYTDTINSARISFRRFNNATQNKYNLNIPSTLLMVRKGQEFKFFEDEKLPDNAESYISTYSSQYNAYIFSNISQLITVMKNERDAGAGVTPADDEATRNAKYAEWEARKENKDWNKVMLIPVAPEYTTSTNAYGYLIKNLVRVRNDFSLSSARIEGGPAGNLRLSIIYSRFAK